MFACLGQWEKRTGKPFMLFYTCLTPPPQQLIHNTMSERTKHFTTNNKQEDSNNNFKHCVLQALRIVIHAA
jgi:hypothetical protein